MGNYYTTEGNSAHVQALGNMDEDNKQIYEGLKRDLQGITGQIIQTVSTLNALSLQINLLAINEAMAENATLMLKLKRMLVETESTVLETDTNVQRMTLDDISARYYGAFQYIVQLANTSRQYFRPTTQT